MSLTELAQHLKASKGSVRDILETLRGHGLLDRDGATKRYRLGPRLVTLGAASTESQDLLSVARPQLAALSESQREVAILLVPEGDRLAIRLAVEPASPRAPLLVSATPGKTFPRTIGACGKVLLAWNDEEGRRELLRAMGRGSRRARAEIAVTRRNGYAVDDEEFMQGVRGVSAPVLGSGGHLVALLLVSGLAGSLTPDRVHGVGAATRVAAEAISRAIGGVDALPGLATRR